MEPTLSQKFSSSVWIGERPGQSVGRALIDGAPDCHLGVNYVKHANEEDKEIEASEHQKSLFERNITEPHTVHHEEAMARQSLINQSSRSQGSQLIASHEQSSLEKEFCFNDNCQIWPVWTACYANPSTSTSISDIFDDSDLVSQVSSESEILDTCAGAAEFDALTSVAPVNKDLEQIEVAENPSGEENGLLTSATQYKSDWKQSLQNFDEIISYWDYSPPTYITDESNPDLLFFLSKTLPFYPDAGPDCDDHSDMVNKCVPLSKFSVTRSNASRIAIGSNEESQGISKKRKIRRRKGDGCPDSVDFHKKKIAIISNKLAKINKSLTKNRRKLVNNDKKLAKSSIRLKKSGKRLTRKSKNLQLYKCIILMLNDPDNKYPHISWLDQGTGIFKIKNTDEFTQSLKTLRGGKKITFANTSRSLRYYQSKHGLLIPSKDLTERFPDTRYIYQFNLRNEKIREALSCCR